MLGLVSPTQSAAVQAQAGAHEGLLQVNGDNSQIARQASTRNSLEQGQQQTSGHSQALSAHQRRAKLHLDARRPGQGDILAGQIHIAQESWLDRATAKARAKIENKS